MPAAPRAFIFDCDGTLVDSMGMWVAVWPELAREYGVTATPEEFDRYEHLSMEEECKAVHRDLGVAPSAAELEARLRETLAVKYAMQVPLRPGVLPFLEAAREAGIPMAIATSTSRDLVVMCLEACGVAGFFRGIVTTSMVGASKEHPDVYDRALALAVPGAARREAWVFEDAMFGLITAERAGYKRVGVFDPAGHADRGIVREHASLFVDSFEDLTLGQVLSYEG